MQASFSHFLTLIELFCTLALLSHSHDLTAVIPHFVTFYTTETNKHASFSFIAKPKNWVGLNNITVFSCTQDLASQINVHSLSSSTTFRITSKLESSTLVDLWASFDHFTDQPNCVGLETQLKQHNSCTFNEWLAFYFNTVLFQGNLALGKPTSQSSTFYDDGLNHVSSLAVDGNTNSSFSDSQFSCTCTNTSDTDPWWYVDLGMAYNVQRVLVTTADTNSEWRLDFKAAF
jgi:hypothetical protein